MLIIDMDPFEPFSDIVSIMHRFDYFAYFHCNPNMFSIFIRESTPPSIITLTMLPQFFTRFFCDQNHYAQFSMDGFYSQLVLHKRLGYESLIFGLAEFRFHMALEFHSSSFVHPSPQLLRTWQPSYHYEFPGKIGYGPFVSLELHDFRNVVLIFDNTKTHVPFRVTISEFKFFLPDKEIIFTNERDGCIIGGIREGEEWRGAMCLNPIEGYFNFTSKRLWLFESYDPIGVTLVAPFGLYVNISTFFPQILV
ncbi:uncharacterized protein LOC103497437 [Cucumis melo]|uniref:Uncharacterized protein LOC103497437 n=1 Tax=Cucumis melo TaxID=3656 RepID=A0A1S4E1P6_CUCME|nr:uncharacterized protein LOC103497437 [Cucumis melo]